MRAELGNVLEDRVEHRWTQVHHLWEGLWNRSVGCTSRIEAEGCGRCGFGGGT
jgi:MoaA/NifB/PqqE/SkfB family radical SAM enzyme